MGDMIENPNKAQYRDARQQFFDSWKPATCPIEYQVHDEREVKKYLTALILAVDGYALLDGFVKPYAKKREQELAGSQEVDDKDKKSVCQLVKVAYGTDAAYVQKATHFL